MMTRTKSRLFLGVGVAGAIALVLLLVCFVLRKQPQQKLADSKSPGPESNQYAIRKKVTPDGNGLTQLDGTVQFTFDGDTKISPGSLVEMTAKMHESEIEIGKQLNRKLEIP